MVYSMNSGQAVQYITRCRGIAGARARRLFPNPARRVSSGLDTEPTESPAMHDTDIARQLATQYALFVDNREFARMAEIMLADFTQQGPGFAADSREVFIANLEFLRNYSETFHLIGNQYGEWQGDSYRGETWCVASHLYEKDGQGRKLDMGIRYQDDIVAVDGEYRYRSRDLKVVFTQDLPLQG
tara:strand:- start:95886 stop:96440 length:555 start_codon:yes stop_codon:yes gene_type:complete